MSKAPVVAVEIGTTKNVALVGEKQEGGVAVIGMGEHPSAGVRKGEIVDIENAVVCVRSALAAAEKSANVAIRQVHLAVTGGHIHSDTNRGSVPVSDRERGVSPAEIAGVEGVARSIHLPPDREILHSFVQYYCLDDQERVQRPLGMGGAVLSVDMLMLHGVRARINNGVRVIENLLLDVEDAVFSGVCSAKAVVTAEQRKAGVIVIDIGGGMTEYAVYVGDVLMALGGIAVGGDHVTNDLALGLSIPPARAEGLKREFGGALPRPELSGRRIAVPAEVGFAGRDVTLRTVDTIVNSRVDEILRIVRRRLEGAVSLHQIGAGVVLTGGGARLQRIAEAAESVFGLPAALGRPINVTGPAAVTEGGEYATTAGLVLYAVQPSETVEAKAPSRGRPLDSLLDRLFDRHAGRG